MPIQSIDIHSKSDCQELINRIRGTLSTVKPSVLGHINNNLQPFVRNDTHIFECLAMAVLSNGTKWNSLEPHLPAIKQILFNYDLVQIAVLSSTDIATLYQKQIQPLRIPSRIKIENKLKWTRDNAKTFLQIQREHGSVWSFISRHLGETFDPTTGRYVHPQDAGLLKCFSVSPYKLGGVGLAICCEFFNNIGIDEFKPDTHTKRFLERVKIVKPKAPNKEVRKAGITIGQTLGQSRKFVDSHIWVFCADGEGEICTKQGPACRLCQLKTAQPQLCVGKSPSPIPSDS